MSRSVQLSSQMVKNTFKSQLTLIISMYAIMLCSSVARSLSSSSSKRLRSCSPNDRYLRQRRRRIMDATLRRWSTRMRHLKPGMYLSIISCGPWSIPIPSRSNITASRKASSQNCSWSHSVERSLPEHRERRGSELDQTHFSSTLYLLHYKRHTNHRFHTDKLDLSWFKRTIKEMFWFSLWEEECDRSNGRPKDNLYGK